MMMGRLMNTDQHRYFDALTERVSGAVFEVSNPLGAGFLEKVYQRALLHELSLRGIRAAAEVSVPVTYKGQAVGEYFADILVEEVLVIESNVPSVSPTNRPRSVSTICEPRAGVCVCSSISRNPGSSGSESSTDFRFPSRLTRRLWPGSHRFVCPAICWTLD